MYLISSIHLITNSRQSYDGPACRWLKVQMVLQWITITWSWVRVSFKPGWFSGFLWNSTSCCLECDDHSFCILHVKPSNKRNELTSKCLAILACHLYLHCMKLQPFNKQNFGHCILKGTSTLTNFELIKIIKLRCWSSQLLVNDTWTATKGKSEKFSL